MMMMGGGLLWAFDITGLDEMRRRLRSGKHMGGDGKWEKDTEEEELEQWLAGILGKGDKRTRDGAPDPKTDAREKGDNRSDHADTCVPATGV